MKTRIITDKRFAYALRWLGFRYEKNEDNHYVFERSFKFDRTINDMYALRADIGGYMYKSIKKESDKNEM